MARQRIASETNAIHEDTVRLVQQAMLPDALFADAAMFFRVMGDNTRFKILWSLDQHEMCVCDLAYLLGMTRSAVSHQLARLKRASLVKSRRDGKNVFYAIADDHVHMMLKGCIDHASEERPQDEGA